MKILQLLFVFLLFSCGSSNNQIKNFATKKDTNSAKSNPCEEVNYQINLTNITKNVFINAPVYVSKFQGNEDSSLQKITYNSYRDPTVIQTSKRRIVFNNVSADYEDRQENYFDFGFNKQINKFLVFAVYYETTKYYLIDKSTNHIDTLQSRPYWSPNFEYIFTFKLNPWMDTEINGKYSNFISDIVIYKRCNDKYKAIFKHSYAFIPLEVRWGSKNNILIKCLSSEDYFNKKSNPNGMVKTQKMFKKISFQ